MVALTNGIFHSSLYSDWLSLACASAFILVCGHRKYIYFDKSTFELKLVFAKSFQDMYPLFAVYK